MYVQSFARYAEAARFDPATGELVVFPRELADSPMVGQFGTVAGHLIVFCHQGDDLFLFSAGHTWTADRSTVASRLQRDQPSASSVCG